MLQVIIVKKLPKLYRGGLVFWAVIYTEKQNGSRESLASIRSIDESFVDGWITHYRNNHQGHMYIDDNVQ